MDSVRRGADYFSRPPADPEEKYRPVVKQEAQVPLEQMPGFADDVETNDTLFRLVQKGWQTDGKKAVISTLQRHNIPGTYASAPEDTSYSRIVLYAGQQGYVDAVTIINGQPPNYWQLTVHKAAFGDDAKRVFELLKRGI